MPGGCRVARCLSDLSVVIARAPLAVAAVAGARWLQVRGEPASSAGGITSSLTVALAIFDHPIHPLCDSEAPAKVRVPGWAQHPPSADSRPILIGKGGIVSNRSFPAY